jgi:hypothetical protein
VNSLHLLYALTSLSAASCFIWGIGSAMMNGIKDSSLGPMLLASLILGVISYALLGVIL